jgi:aminotransferase
MLNISERGFVSAGLSKTHALAGWRIGWLISPVEIAGQVTALHQYLVTSGPSPLHEAALQAFEPEGIAYRDALAAQLVERRELARGLFEDAGFEIRGGDGAFYLFARHPRYPDDLQLIEHLMAHAGVIMIPGRAFGPGGEGFVRISYAAAPEKLREAARRVKAALAD